MPSSDIPSDVPSEIKRKIEVVPYDPFWAELFEIEAKRIQEVLGTNCLEVHHIGSTAIPHLSAKPIIDMLPVVENIQEVDQANQAMEALGYKARGEYGIPFRRYFQKGNVLRTHHLHVYQAGNPEISRYLKFRDWMRSHPADAQNYAKLKEELAAKFPHDIHEYTHGKEGFIASIDAKDGFEGWRIVQAVTEREWNAVRRLRNNHFFQEREDPYTRTFTDQDHIHFVLYKNIEIIGYAHLQLWPHHRAALRMIVINDAYLKQGFGSLFLKLCERWLNHKGFHQLLIQSTQKAYPFYRKHGYTEMPFNDPEEYKGDPYDIEIGKCLTGSVINDSPSNPQDL